MHQIFNSYIKAKYVTTNATSNEYWILKAVISNRSNHAAFGEFIELVFIDSTRVMPLNDIEMHA